MSEWAEIGSLSARVVKLMEVVVATTVVAWYYYCLSVFLLNSSSDHKIACLHASDSFTLFSFFDLHLFIRLEMMIEFNYNYKKEFHLRIID